MAVCDRERDTKPVPAKALKRRAWLNDQITWQNLTIKLNSPAKYTKIKRTTKKITGKFSTSKAYKKKIYIDLTTWGRSLANPIQLTAVREFLYGGFKQNS